MSEANPLQIITLLLLVINSVVAAGAYIRSGRWRTTEAAKAIDAAIARFEDRTASDEGGASIKTDIHRIRNDIMAIQIRLATAEQATERVSIIEGRITGIETTLQHMASRSDIESVKGEIGGIDHMVRTVQAATTRIETFLMERAR